MGDSARCERNDQFIRAFSTYAKTRFPALTAVVRWIGFGYNAAHQWVYLYIIIKDKEGKEVELCFDDQLYFDPEEPTLDMIDRCIRLFLDTTNSYAMVRDERHNLHLRQDEIIARLKTTGLVTPQEAAQWLAERTEGKRPRT